MKIFKEEQKFNQPLVIIGLSSAFLIIGLAIYKSWPEVEAGSLGEKIGAFSGLIIVALVSLLFVFLKLKTRVDEIGIHYKFMPFQLNFKTINWDSISTCTIRNYDAISEYGGWGMKFSFFGKKGKSYTTKGSIGLQLVLKNEQKILIGTQKKEELQRTLDTYKHKVMSAEN
jgi:hypothetical protein